MWKKNHPAADVKVRLVVARIRSTLPMTCAHSKSNGIFWLKMLRKTAQPEERVGQVQKGGISGAANLREGFFWHAHIGRASSESNGSEACVGKDFQKYADADYPALGIEDTLVARKYQGGQSTSSFLLQKRKKTKEKNSTSPGRAARNRHRSKAKHVVRDDEEHTD
jgi:hypothetical protein